ncbi:hypothetical protein LCGC14_0545220 [marine sediment metagenome]|uniref:Outer membrane efflux protein n=1 Tax=marine sediment metagenome TaxID=412755 RepID=A0A0F9UZR2_9ZZZZ
MWNPLKILSIYPLVCYCRIGLLGFVLCVSGCSTYQHRYPVVPDILKSPYEQKGELPSDLKDVAIEVHKSDHNENKAEVKTIQRISLANALDRALAENVDIGLARAEEQIAQTKDQVSKGVLLPVLEFSGGAARTDGRVQGSFGELRDVEFNTYNPQVAMGYHINLGSQIHKALATRRDLDFAVLQTLHTEQRLLLRVIELYQNLALSRIGIKIAEQLVADSEQFVRIASTRTALGVGLGSEVARAKAKLASDRQQLVQARNIWETSSVRLAVVLRLNPRVLLEPTDEKLVPINLIPSPETWKVEENVRVRPDIKAAVRRTMAASHQVSAAWWDLLGPELTAEVRQIYIGDRLSSGFNDRTDSRLLLSWTFSFDKIGRINQRKAEEALARLNLMKIEDKAFGEVQIARQEIHAAMERIRLAKDGLEAAQSNHHISLARFQAGMAIVLEVLDAEDARAQAQLDIALSIVAFNLAQVRLLTAAGIIHRDLFGR